MSAAWLQSEGQVGPGLYGGGSLVWRRVSTGEQTASIGYHVNTLAGEPPTIRLYYTTTRRGEDQRERLDYPVGLTTRPLPWCGVRRWFVCPLVVNGLSCGRRVGKLYLPPGGPGNPFAGRVAGLWAPKSVPRPRWGDCGVGSALGSP